MGRARDVLKKYKESGKADVSVKNKSAGRASKVLQEMRNERAAAPSPKRTVNPVVQKIVNDAKKPLPLPGQNTKAATFTPLPVFTQNKTNNTIDTSKYGFTVNDNGTIKKGVQPSTTPTNIQTTLQQTPEKLTEEKKAELKKERNEIRDQIGVLRFVPDSGVDYLKNKVPSAAHLWDDRVKYGEKQNAYLQYSRELKQQQDAEHIANIIVKAKTDPQYTALSIPKAEGHKKDLYAFINNINNYQNAVRASNSLNIDNGAKESEAGAWTKYIYMTDDEKGIYNYLYAKEGEKSADSFLDAIANTLNQRVGKAVVEDFENKNSVYKATTAAGIALRSGVDQFGTGIKQLVKDDAVETSPIQYAGQEVRNNLSGAGAVAYDFLQTTANMAPSILVSVATNGLLSGLSAGGAIASAVGSATMGASAAGNAYKEMRENGYDVGEARVYGLMIGASEATLEHLLGGIKALGGKKGLGSVLAKNLGAVDNAYKRIAIDIGKQALSEASEEALQEIIEPILASVVLSDTYSPAEIENIMYSALLGALSGGVFESAGSVSNAMASQTAGNQIIKNGKTNDVITAGINTDTETESRALAEQLRERQEKGKKITPYQLGELKRQTDFATAQKEALPEQVQQPKPKMGSNGQRGFAETYVGDTVETVAPKDATAGYKAVYNSTIENRAMTETEAQAAAKIPDTMVRAAESAARADMPKAEVSSYKSAVREAETLLPNKIKNVENVVSHGEQAGFDSTNAPKHVTKTQHKILDDLYKAMGVKGFYADGLKGNAEIYANKGVAPIARDFQTETIVNGKKKKLSAVYHGAHEVAMHRLMELAPEAGQAFINALNKYMSVGGAIDLIGAKRAQYAAQGVDISNSEAMEEIAANAILSLYHGKEAEFHKAIDRIIKGEDAQARNGAIKFREILDEIIAKLKNIVSKLSGKERAEAQADVDKLTELRNLFETAFAEGVAKNKELVNNATIDANGVVTNKNSEKVKAVIDKSTQKNTDLTDGDVKFSLKNKNLTIKSRIPFTALTGYIKVAKDDSVALGRLETKVKNLKRGTYKNNATGYQAAITSDTIGKAITPARKEKIQYTENHIRNLNAMLKLPELFKKAVYVDSKPPQKAKNQNKEIKEFHHFVAPVSIGNDTYRALITAREKEKSNTLYVLKVEVLPMQKKAHSVGSATKNVVSQLWSVPFDVSIPELVNGVKIYNYDTGKTDVYSGKDIKFSLRDSEYIDAVNKGDMLTAQSLVVNAARAAGYTRRMFHETDAQNIHVFDISRGDHGGTDSETPYGIFTKTSDKNIGLGSRQMSLFVKADNTLYVKDRADVKNKIPELIPYYDEIARIDRKYEALTKELEEAEFDALSEWMDENPDADMDKVYPTSYIIEHKPADIDSPKYLNAFAEYEKAREAWGREYDKVAIKCKELITSHLRSNGYDSMYFLVDGGSRGRQTDSLIVLDSNQVKSADPVTYDDNGNVIPLSERFNPENEDIRYSLRNDNDIDLEEAEEIQKAASDSKKLKKYVESGAITSEDYNRLIEKYGAIEPGENPARDVQVPKKTSDDKKVRKFARTAMESGSLPDEFASEMEKEIVDGTFSYIPMGDKKTLQRVNESIEYDGWEKSLKKWEAVVNGTERADKNKIVLGEMLLVNAANSGDIKLATRLAAELAAEATRAGQEIQAIRLLKKMSPEGRLYHAQQHINKLQEDLNERYGIGKHKIKVPEELYNNLINAKTQEEVQAAEEELFINIAEQVPSTLYDKWNAWRYFSMLANPRTHVRNFVGNLVFMPVRGLKNMTKILLENVLFTKTADYKTASLKAYFRTAENKSLREFIKKDREQNGVVGKSSKYSPENIISENQKVFRSKMFAWLEWARRKNFEWLEKEDMFFKKIVYDNSFLQYIHANKYTQEFLESGTKEAKAAMEKGRQYAIEEALKATYQDANKVAEVLNKITRMKKDDNIAVKAGKAVVEGVFPFKKTPMNIVKRAVEYSPAGLFSTVIRSIAKVETRKYTPQQAIDRIASGLTGTGLLAMGAWLASMGLLKGKLKDDDKEDKYKKFLGEQGYSLVIGDHSYTLDWAAPSVLPLFVGVEMYEQRKKTADEDLSLVSNLLGALKNATEPMMELSMLQGLNDALNSVSYSDNKLPDLIGPSLISYATQGIPTLFGQVARTIDDTRRSTYASKSSKMTKGMEYAMRKAAAKIPGVSMLLEPYVDEWGNEVKNDNLFERSLENFVSPGYHSKREADKVEKEIERLYKATSEASVLPKRAENTVSYKEKNYYKSPAEATKFQKTYGKTSYEMREKVYKTAAYKKLSEEQKVDVTEQITSYANDVAKAEFFKKRGVAYTVEKFTEKVTELKNEGIPESTTFLAWALQKDIEGIKDKNGDTVNKSASLKKRAAIDAANPSLSFEKRKLLYAAFKVGSDVIKMSDSSVKTRLAAMERMYAKYNK